MAGLICGGNVYLATYKDDGTLSDYLDPVNATKLEISAQGGEIKERKSKMRDTYAQTLDSVSVPESHQVSVSFDDFSGHVLALAFSGTSAAISQAAKSSQTATLDLSSGDWVEIGAKGIKTATITSKTEGQHFEINKRLGLIRRLGKWSGSTDASVTLTYSTSDISGTVVGGATRTQINVKMMLDGKNLADGSDIIVTIDKANLNADSTVDFLADDFSGVDLTGTCVTLPGNASPYRVEQPKYT